MAPLLVHTRQQCQRKSSLATAGTETYILYGLLQPAWGL